MPTLISSSKIALKRLVASGLPNLPSERAEGQEGSAEAQPADHDMNYGKPYHHTLARLPIQHVGFNLGSAPGFLSIVVQRSPILSRKESKGKKGLKVHDLLTTRVLTKTTVNPARIPLPPTSPSANPPCLHQVGPESGISSTVDVPILPRKEKRARGVCLQIHCLTTLTCTTVNPSMISTDKIPITYHRNADEMPKKYLYRYNTDTISIRYR